MIKKQIKKTEKWDFYKTKMAGLLAAGWKVKEETKWYADIHKDTSKWSTHIILWILFFIMSAYFSNNYYMPILLPFISNIIYSRLSREERRILKPIRQ